MKKFTWKPRRSLLALAILSATGTVLAEPQTHHLSIAPQSMSDALKALAAETHIQIFSDGDALKGKQSSGIQGDFTAREALQKLLTGTGLTYIFTADDAVAVKAAENGSNATSTLPAVTVEGKPVSDLDSVENTYNRKNASTATKTETPLMETPGTVNVITRKQIEDRQSWTPDEALKYTAGVNSPSGGGRTPYDQAFILRGFSTGETGDIGGFYYRDGFRMSGIPIAMGNVERIELLKGPASVLYGRAEPGGLINVVYKKPQATPHYVLEQQFGNYDFYRTNVDATGALTEDNKVLYRFNLQNVNSESFVPYVENNLLSLSPQLTWNINDRTQINFQLDYSRTEFTYPQGNPVIGGQIADVPHERLLELYKPTEPDGHSENYVAAVDLTHQFNDNWKLKWNGLYANQELNWIRGGRVTISGIDPDTGIVDRGNIIAEPNNNREWWFTQLNLTGSFVTFGIKHTMLMGFDYLRERFHGPQLFIPLNGLNYNVFSPRELSIPRPSREQAIAGGDWFEQSNDWFGIYLQDQVDLTDRLHLTLGGRYDNADNYQGYSPEDAQRPVNNEALNPRYGIVYQPFNWLSTYYQYQESFGTNNGRSFDGKPFSPQTAQQHEIGVKTEFFGGALSSNLAIFHLTKQNLLTTDPDNDSRQRAIGEAASRGIEWDVAGRLTERLSLIAAYTYTDTEITADNDGNLGKKLPNVPDSSGNLWLTYDVTDSFKVGSGAYVAGRRKGDSGNSWDLPGYVRMDAMAAYKFRIGRSALTAQVNVNNVLDKEYYVNSNAGLAAYPGAPLTVLGSLRFEY
ncbi:TonB-dependent siderophore receptor [Methylomonas sp. TEB]|uniref:TonB-dependent siderophore receptor n=1 Tax=Methylomonas sp. TEB TaxID=3398229 RepID=UPI0039F5D2E6